MRKGGWEFPAFWVLALIAQALLGDGPFTLVQTSWLGKAFEPANASQQQAL
jgi:putative oxidoreductase